MPQHPNTPTTPLSPPGITIGAQIGKGGQAKVYSGIRTRDGKKVFIKRYSGFLGIEGRPVEAHILRHILPQHPRLMKCECYHVYPNTWADVVFEFYGGGDLLDNGPKSGSGMPDEFVWHVFLGIADALALMRESGVLLIFLTFRVVVQTPWKMMLPPHSTP